MNAVWGRMFGVLIVIGVLLLFVVLAVSALASGEDWDDDAGKGE
jgi:hypothetical protein